MDRGSRLPFRLHSGGLSARAHLPQTGHPHGGQRQHWRHQRVALGRQGTGRCHIHSRRAERLFRRDARRVARRTHASILVRSATSKRWLLCSPCLDTCSPSGCVFAAAKAWLPGSACFFSRLPWRRSPAITLFAIVLALSRYVSLSSILGAASFPGVRLVHGVRNRDRILHRRAERRCAADHREASSEYSPAAVRH